MANDRPSDNGCTDSTIYAKEWPDSFQYFIIVSVFILLGDLRGDSIGPCVRNVL